MSPDQEAQNEMNIFMTRLTIMLVHMLGKHWSCFGQDLNRQAVATRSRSKPKFKYIFACCRFQAYVDTCYARESLPLGLFW